MRAVASGALSACFLLGDRREHVAELLRRRYRTTEIALCGSGTEALVLALRLARRRLGPSTPVALPAFTCFDVASAAVAADVPIVLYDLDPTTLSPDLESLGRQLAEGARAAVIAPLYGLPVDYDAVEALLARYDALAIEDAAQGLGAAWRGRPLGSFGALSVLSFGRGKGWSGGRGGALLVGSRELATALEDSLTGGPRSELRALFTAGAQWALGRPQLYGIPASIPWLGLGETRYRDAPSPGRLARAAARMLERMQRRADLEAEARRLNAEKLLSCLAFGPHVQSVRPLEGATPGFLRLPVRLSRGMLGFGDPERARRLGIAASYPSTLADLAPVRARMKPSRERWTGADELARSLVTLPTHSLLADSERTEVCRLVADYTTPTT